MKKVVLLFILFLSFNVYSQEYPQNIDGKWIGKITMADERISYELELNVQTKKDGGVVATAETQNGKLAIRRLDLEWTDVHSPLWFDAEFMEVIKDPDSDKEYHYFRLILKADVTEENVLSGDAEQTFNDQPVTGRAYGTFFLRKVNPKKWY